MRYAPRFVLLAVLIFGYSEFFHVSETSGVPVLAVSAENVETDSLPAGSFITDSTVRLRDGVNDLAELWSLAASLY